MAIDLTLENMRYVLNSIHPETREEAQKRIERARSRLAGIDAYIEEGEKLFNTLKKDAEEALFNNTSEND